MTHVLKCWPYQFNAVVSGIKTHEVRDIGDRSFAVGDKLLLMEYDREADVLSGAWAECLVTFVTVPDTFGLSSKVCVMSIRLLEASKP